MNANDSKPPAPKESFAAAVIVTVLTVLMYLAAVRVAPGYNVLAVIALLALMMIGLGWAIVGTPLGVLISELNVMSLSRLQLAGWTAVVLGTYFTYFIMRVHQGAGDPLAISADWRLWALVGISTSSMVGSTLITSIKKDQQPKKEAIDKAAAAVKEDKQEVDANRQGTLYANQDKRDAKFTDLFQGDELVNTTHVDLAKVQMFFFTLVTLTAYAYLAAKELRHPAGKDFASLPALSEGMLMLLGISHAGYLGNKSISHTQKS